MKHKKNNEFFAYAKKEIATRKIEKKNGRKSWLLVYTPKSEKLFHHIQPQNEKYFRHISIKSTYSNKKGK